MSKRRSAPILIELIRDRTDLRQSQRSTGSGAAVPSRSHGSETLDLPFKSPPAQIEVDKPRAAEVHTGTDDLQDEKTESFEPTPKAPSGLPSGARDAQETVSPAPASGGLMPATSTKRAPVTSATRPSSAPSTSAGGSAGSAALVSSGTIPSGLSRTWRVPIGFVLVYIGATLILIAVAYSTGHRFGREKAENSFIAGLSQTPAQEPINNNGSSDTNTQRPITGGFGDGTESRNQGPTQPQSSQDSRSQPNGSGSGAASRSGNQAAPAASITTDTRENGYNYIIVEQFPADEASRVADYLIRNGIDVMILPANDRSLRRVVVRQGYLGWRSNQEGQQTLDSVRRLGWAWRSRHGGSKDFEQAFVELFD